METNKDMLLDDEDREAAATRRLTLSPLHADVTPEPLPQSDRSGTNINNPGIANVPSDTEHEDTVIQPSRSYEEVSAERPEISRATTIYVATSAVALIVASVAIVYVITKQ